MTGFLHRHRQVLSDVGLGFWLYVLVMLGLLFATGEDTSFIYIDF